MKKLINKKFISIAICFCMIFFIFAQYFPTFADEGPQAYSYLDSEFEDNVGKQAIFDWWASFDIASDIGSKPGMVETVEYDELGVDELVVLLDDYYYDSEAGQHWYKVSPTKGGTLPEILSNKPWVLYLTDKDAELGCDPTLAVYDKDDVIKFITTQATEGESVSNNYYVMAGPKELLSAQISIKESETTDYPTSSLIYTDPQTNTSWSKALDVSIIKEDGSSWSPSDGEVSLRYLAESFGNYSYNDYISCGVAFLYVGNTVFSAEATDIYGYESSDIVYVENGSATLVLEHMNPSFYWVGKTGYFNKDAVALYNNQFSKKECMPSELPDTFNVDYAFTHGGVEYYWLKSDEFSKSQYFIVKASDVSFVLEDSSSGVTVSGQGIPSDAGFAAKIIVNEDELDAVFHNIGKALYPNDLPEDQMLVLNRDALVLDLSFHKNGEAVQPNGKLNITTSVKSLGVEDGEECIIYHLHDDGTVEALYSIAEDGKVTFGLDSFSIVVISGSNGAAYNVSQYYGVGYESSSGNNQFHAEGIYFTKDGEAHLLINGDFNPKQAEKIETIYIDGVAVLELTNQNFSNHIVAKSGIRTLTLYTGADKNTTVLHTINETNYEDWLDINLGKNVKVEENFQLKVETSTGGGQEGKAFNFGMTVVANLDYGVVKTVHKVGDVEYNTESVPGSVGKEVIFKIDAVNRGNVDIIGAKISEFIPSGVFDDATISYSTDLISWNSVGTKNFDIMVGDLLGEQTKTYYVKAMILNSNIPEGTCTNNVELSSESHGIVANDDASITFSGSYNIDKVVETVNGKAPQASGSAEANKSAEVKAGDTVVYKITVNNDGTNPLNDVTITDFLPRGAYSGTVYWGNSSNPTSAVNPSIMGEFTVPTDVDVPAKSSVSYYVKIVVKNDVLSGTYANKAKMDVTLGSNKVSLESSADIVVPVILNYGIEKDVYSVNGTTIAQGTTPDVNVGDTVVYKVTVENNGNNALDGTSIVDTLPGCMDATSVAYSTSPTGNWTTATVTDGKITFNAGELQDGKYSILAGSTYTYYVKMTIASDVENGGVYKNVAALHTNNELCRDDADVNLIVKTTLTIKKDGYSIFETVDPNQTFMFKVTGEDTDLIVTIHGDGQTTIGGLKVGGRYTVTEISDWSWRYEVDTDKTAAIQTITLPSEGGTVEFANNRKNIYWLDGDHFLVNVFNGKIKQ
ncbi:MAG: DUF11 domain-containing protein [Firmicutes bacterium]|nr:DUF11 domain-containing protein [Bacillota bacterium]